MNGEKRLGVGVAAGLLFTALFAVTWLWPNWIELTLGAEPDAGNGETEWSIVIVFGLAALAAWAFAGWGWRRLRLGASAR